MNQNATIEFVENKLVIFKDAEGHYRATHPEAGFLFEHEFFETFSEALEESQKMVKWHSQKCPLT